MHIKEVDEHIDYRSYWTFPPEVHDITVAAGHRFWRDLEGIADHYPCGTCKPGAQAIAHGSHDMISLLLNKPNAPQTPKEFVMLHEMMDAAWLKYRKKSRHQVA